MKRRKPVNKVSAKRRAELKIYRKLRKQFLDENPKCAVYPNKKATDIHHVRGRAGRLYLCTRYWLAVCRQAHIRIGEEPEWARANGFLAQRGEWGKQPEEDTESDQDKELGGEV
tara:strand:+ start:4729 stop:5070 length:342 start_codon:yes stop_codon:yes gene_type:complete